LVLIARGRKTYYDIRKLASTGGVVDEWTKCVKHTFDINIDEAERGITQPSKASLCRLYTSLLMWLSFKEESDYTDPIVISPELLADKYKNIDPEDVGVIACKVDLTHPNMEQLGGMDEYRVPAESILACTGVYFPAEHGGGYL
jgi:hypothetical protein